MSRTKRQDAVVNSSNAVQITSDLIYQGSLRQLIPTLAFQNPEDILSKEKQLRDVYEMLSKSIVTNVEYPNKQINTISSICAFIIKVLITQSNNNIGIFHHYFYIIYLLTKVCRTRNQIDPQELTAPLASFITLITEDSHTIKANIDSDDTFMNGYGLCLEIVRSFIGVLINITMLYNHRIKEKNSNSTQSSLSVLDLEIIYRTKVKAFALINRKDGGFIGVHHNGSNDLFYLLYDKNTKVQMAFPTHILFHMFSKTDTLKLKSITYNPEKCMKVRGTCFDNIYDVNYYLKLNFNKATESSVVVLPPWPIKNVSDFFNQYRKTDIPIDNQDEPPRDLMDIDTGDVPIRSEEEEEEHHSSLLPRGSKEEEDEMTEEDKMRSIIFKCLSLNTFVGSIEILDNDDSLINYFININLLAQCFPSFFIKIPEVLTTYRYNNEELRNLVEENEEDEEEKDATHLTTFLKSNTLVVAKYPVDTLLEDSDELDTMNTDSIAIARLTLLDGIFPCWDNARVDEPSYGPSTNAALFTDENKASMLKGMIIFDNMNMIPEYMVKDYVYSLKRNGVKEQDITESQRNPFPVLIWRGHIHRSSLLDNISVLGWLFFRCPLKQVETEEGEDILGLNDMKLMALYPPTDLIMATGNKINYVKQKQKVPFPLEPAECLSFQTTIDDFKVIDTNYTFIDLQDSRFLTIAAYSGLLDIYSEEAWPDIRLIRIIRLVQSDATTYSGGKKLIAIESLWLINIKDLYTQAVLSSSEKFKMDWPRNRMYPKNNPKPDDNQNKTIESDFLNDLIKLDHSNIIFSIGIPFKVSVMVSLEYIMMKTAMNFVSDQSKLKTKTLSTSSKNINLINTFGYVDLDKTPKSQWNDSKTPHLYNDLRIYGKKPHTPNTITTTTTGIISPYEKLDKKESVAAPINSILHFYWAYVCLGDFIKKYTEQKIQGSISKSSQLEELKITTQNKLRRLYKTSMIENSKVCIPGIFSLEVDVKLDQLKRTILEDAEFETLPPFNTFKRTFVEVLGADFIDEDEDDISKLLKSAKSKLMYSLFVPYIHLNSAVDIDSDTDAEESAE